VEGGGRPRGAELVDRAETTIEWGDSIYPWGEGGARGELSVGGGGVGAEGHESLSLGVEEAGTTAVSEGTLCSKWGAPGQRLGEALSPSIRSEQ
jgi:hypothetical protein